MEAKDIERLIEVLDNLELHIQERTHGLNIRRSALNPSDPSVGQMAAELHVLGVAETLSAWISAKGYILSAFPEVAKIYQPKQYFPFLEASSRQSQTP